MSDIRHLRAKRQQIEIHGASLTVRGLSVSFLADLAEENRRIAALLESGGNPSPTQFALAVARVAPAIIAYACGKEGDAEFLADAAEMVIEDQIEIIAQILALTFPRLGGGKVGEFLARLNATTHSSNESASTSAAPASPANASAESAIQNLKEMLKEAS